MNPGLSSSTKSRILQAANELFFRQGIKRITMDDIAGHLGMSKKTIYRSFRDKNELVTALTVQELETQALEMSEIRKSSENSVDEIVQVMGCVSRTFGRTHPSLFYDLQKYHGGAWDNFRIFKEKELTGFIEENLRRGIRFELYRKNLKIKILARLRIEEIEMGFNPAIFPPGKFPITEVQLEMLDHFLHGIVTLKGFKLIDKYKRLRLLQPKN